jgi:hypothetical protein
MFCVVVFLKEMGKSGILLRGIKKSRKCVVLKAAPRTVLWGGEVTQVPQNQAEKKRK